MYLPTRETLYREAAQIVRMSVSVMFIMRDGTNILLRRAA